MPKTLDKRKAASGELAAGTGQLRDGHFVHKQYTRLTKSCQAPDNMSEALGWAENCVAAADHALELGNHTAADDLLGVALDALEQVAQAFDLASTSAEGSPWTD